MSLPQKYTALLAYGQGVEPKLQQLPLPKPSKNQVLVKIAFTPLNPADIMSISGVYPLDVTPPFLVGLEGSGTVVALGEDLKVSHQMGDRVHVVGLGTLGEYMLADADKCRKIQGDLSFEDAASHFINPATVVAMGDYLTKHGHKALIHTASSSAIGRMMNRYFRHKGVKTINIVRRDDVAAELLKDGADYVLNSEAPDFEARLKEIAHREKATLAYDAVGGDLTAKVLRNQPNGSTLAIYGRLAGGGISELNVQQFLFEGKTITGFWMTKYMDEAAASGDAARLMDEVYELLPSVLTSSIHRVFKLNEIKEALAYNEKNSSKGKILIQLH